MAERRRNRVTLNVVRPRKKKNFVIEKVDAPVKVKPADPSRPPLLSPDQIDAETSCRTATAHTADTESESVFTRRKLKAVEAWEELRRSTLRAAVESMCLPDVLCYNCNGNPAEVRCVQCGPTAFFCQHCTISLHTTVRLSHTPEIWKVYYNYTRQHNSFTCLNYRIIIFVHLTCQLHQLKHIGITALGVLAER